MNKAEIWNAFIDKQGVDTRSVPLFEQGFDGYVKTKVIGKTQKRTVLKRNQAMEDLVVFECQKLIQDWESETNSYDGLIYMMLTSGLQPLYIGKAETFGKGDGNLSANIKGIKTDRSKFARWGDNYAYHIGDLSAVVLPGHDSKYINKKYQDWASAIFEDFPTRQPCLKNQVLFWCKAWPKEEIGIWEEFGSTRLTFLEYLLIGVASSLFPDTLLNREGQNREGR